MRKHACRLSARLSMLTVAAGGAAVLLVALSMLSVIPALAGVLALPGVGLVYALALYRWVYRPLRAAEHALGAPEEPFDRILARLDDADALEGFTAGRTLRALSGKVHAQYDEALLRGQVELRTLQSQINPHFLYNTLDSIRGQALFQGAADIADMTEALSTFFRYSISNRDNVVTLEEELENVRNYFKIQQFRFNNRFRLSILPIARADLEQCRLPKLSLQPILENAILHGMEGMLATGTITIRVEGTERLVRITVSDDGMGMNEETLLALQARVRGEAVEARAHGRSTGLALPNVARRIRLMFGEHYGMQIMSTVGAGTDVVVLLPRQQAEGVDGA